jgi:alcohol dehydrogenase class IV
MHWAATLAGTALNNAGTALPHGCSYPVSGGVKADDERRHFAPKSGYPNRAGGKSAALLPHGYAVAVMAPAAFEVTAFGSPDRHLQAAQLLAGKDYANNATASSSGGSRSPEDCGGLLVEQLVKLMRLTGDCPLGLAEMGFQEADIPAMVQGTIVQQRVLSVVPLSVDEELLEGIFKRALRGY